MADYNVTVSIPSPINTNVVAPPSAQTATITMGAPGPQGPIGPSGAIGPVGPVGPVGPSGFINTGELDSRYVRITGNQVIQGNKSFVLAVTAPNLVYHTGNQNIQGHKNFLDEISSTNLVYNTGNQSISGAKSFSNRIAFLNPTSTYPFNPTISGRGSNDGEAELDIDAFKLNLRAGYSKSEFIELGGEEGRLNINTVADTSTFNLGYNHNSSSTGIYNITSPSINLYGQLNGKTGTFEKINGATNLVYNTGTQLIQGDKWFQNKIRFTPDGSLNTTSYISNDGSSNIKMFGDLITLTNNSATVQLDGQEIILNGNVLVNGTPVIKSGEPSIVYTTGYQVITGFKLFNSIAVNDDTHTNTVTVNTIFDQEDSSSTIEMRKNSINLNPGLATPTGRINLNGNVYVSNNILAKTGLFEGITANNLVYNTGNQTISGVKTFASRPTVNGTGFLLSGEAGALPSTIVYTTGNQNISGVKTFLNNVQISGTGIFNALDLNNIDIISLSGVDVQIINGNVSLTNTPTVNGNLVLTGVDLTPYATISSLNSLSGVSVLTFGNQGIYGNKIFYDNVSINNLTVTGTQTIANISNTNVPSNYILLNITGGAVDGGVFFVTGDGLTGASNNGAIIGYSKNTNKFKFGTGSRSAGLSLFKTIAAQEDLDTLSGNAVLIYGDQTIQGTKTLTFNGSESLIVSGAAASKFAARIVNSSNQGNGLYIKKGATIGSPTVAQNFVIRAVDGLERDIFTVKSNNASFSDIGFFCDPDNFPPAVGSDNIVVSGKSNNPNIYISNTLDDRYLNINATSLSNVNGLVTGNIRFLGGGEGIVMYHNETNFDYAPIKVAEDNNVYINGNDSFGIYQRGTLYPNTGPLDLTINQLTSRLNSLNFYYGIVSGTDFLSGLKPGHLLYYTTKNNAASNFVNNARTRAKARPYMVVDDASNYSNSYTVNTSPINPGNNGNFSFLKFNNNSQYSGLAIKQLIFNPTIQNAYRSYNLWSGVNIEVKPQNIHLETFIDVDVKSGNYWSQKNLGIIRYPNNITVKKPKATNFTQSHVLNFKLNFQRDDRVTKVANYPNRIVTIYNPDNIPTITITGYDYEFSQKLRLILNTDGSLKEW